MCEAPLNNTNESLWFTVHTMARLEEHTSLSHYLSAHLPGQFVTVWPLGYMLYSVLIDFRKAHLPVPVCLNQGVPCYRTAGFTTGHLGQRSLQLCLRIRNRQGVLARGRHIDYPPPAAPPFNCSFLIRSPHRCPRGIIPHCSSLTSSGSTLTQVFVKVYLSISNLYDFILLLHYNSERQML